MALTHTSFLMPYREQLCSSLGLVLWFSANDVQACIRATNHCPGHRHCACNTGKVVVALESYLGQLQWLCACHMSPAL